MNYGEKYQLLHPYSKGQNRWASSSGEKTTLWLSNIRDWSGVRNAGELFHLASVIVVVNVRKTEQSI